MSDLSTEAVEWLAKFAAALGVDPPAVEDIERILALAGVAAHASHRQAAPVSAWLAAKAGVDPACAIEIASRV